MPMGGVMSDETQTSQPAQGWYPDPSDASKLRWWDGNAWTDHTHDASGASAQTETAQQPAATTPAASAPATSTTGPGGIVSNPAPAAGAAGSRPAPSSRPSSGDKGAVGQWLSVRSNQVLLVILLIAIALFLYVMLIY
jgi:cobalamin biosynthesis Mg chelatase CobN